MPILLLFLLLPPHLQQPIICILESTVVLEPTVEKISTVDPIITLDIDENYL